MRILRYQYIPALPERMPIIGNTRVFAIGTNNIQQLLLSALIDETNQTNFQTTAQSSIHINYFVFTVVQLMNFARHKIIVDLCTA